MLAALHLHEGATFDASTFTEFLDAQPDLSPKWVPRFVRISKAGLQESHVHDVIINKEAPNYRIE